MQMHMQEPEQWQSSGQEEQASQEYNQYRAQYPGAYESEQQQKIYPQEERRLHGADLALLTISILSSVGFFLTVAGIVASAIVLKYANGQQALLAGGAIGLVGSIGGFLICVAIFVISIVTLAMHTRKILRRARART